jgi:hypothetical protein
MAKDDDRRAKHTTALAQELAVGAAEVTINLQDMKTADLYAALGAEISGAAQGSAEISRFAVTVDPNQLDRGVFSDIGERLFKRWNQSLHDFLCKPSDEDKDLRGKVLAALASKDISASCLIIGVLVGTFGVAPAIATLVAALVVQLVVKPAADEICKYWDEQLAAK